MDMGKDCLRRHNRMKRRGPESWFLKEKENERPQIQEKEESSMKAKGAMNIVEHNFKYY